MQFTRRDFLRHSAATAVSVFAYSLVAESSRLHSVGECIALQATNAFTLGISSGDVTANEAIVWTKYTGPFSLKIAVWETTCDLRRGAIVFMDVIPKEGGYIHINVTQLKPYTAYQFAFMEFDQGGWAVGRSRVGNFRTSPHRDMMVPLTLGAVSCTHNDYDPVVLEHAGARNDIDVFLLLGDTVYNDGCSTPQQFRDSWGVNLRKKGYLDLRASTSVISTLDDHEIYDNFDPETVPIAVRNAALKSYFDHTPFRGHPERKSRIWRSFRWGRTCEIFVLDCRTERRPSTRHGFKNQYVSRQQMDWLKEGLASSNSLFKIIMNSVPIGTFPFFYESDRWEGYPQQRREILSFIDENDIPGVLWLAGDFHFASVGRVSPHGSPGCRQTEILAGPGAQIPNYLAAALNGSPQFDWASVRNNYVTLKLDPGRYQLKLVYHGGSEDPRKTNLSEICEIYSQTMPFQARDETEIATLQM